METIFRTMGLALGTIALSTTAAAQQDQNTARNNNRVISAALNVGGVGNFTGVVDPAAGQLCYILNAGGIDSPTAARIQAAEPGGAGPVLALQAPTDGASGECTQIGAELARALAENPERYMLEVVSATRPADQVRAQLTSGRTFGR